MIGAKWPRNGSPSCSTRPQWSRLPLLTRRVAAYRTRLFVGMPSHQEGAGGRLVGRPGVPQGLLQLQTLGLPVQLVDHFLVLDVGHVRVVDVRGLGQAE